MRRSRVFISYRRADGAGHAGRLEEDLQRALGGRVFMDVSDIAPGRDFEAAIRAELQSCRVTLAVIGRRWTQILHEGQQKGEVDFVRLELGEALKDEQVTVVPLLLDGARLPSADELPEDLRALVRRQARSIRDDRWQRDVEDLAAELRPLLGVSRIRALLARAPWLVPVVLSTGVVFALAVWMTIQGVGRTGDQSGPPTPDPASLDPFDRAEAHRLTIDATRQAVTDCMKHSGAGASGECPVLFELVDDGTVRTVYYPVGYCDFKNTPFGNCVLRDLAGLRIPPFAEPSSAEVQLGIRVSPDGVTVEVDE